MSSLLEGLAWEHKHQLLSNASQWKEWILHLEQVVDLPVYDLSRILDVSAAFDMVQHAYYYNGTGNLYNVTVPASCVQALRDVGLHELSQMKYFIQALYSHCSQYTIGMRNISPPDTQHMQNIPVVPYYLFKQLQDILMFPRNVYAWLHNIIACRSERAFTTCVCVRPVTACSGRRGRKHETATQHNAMQDQLYNSVQQVFREMQQLSPDFAPRVSCSVCSAGSRGFMVTLLPKQVQVHVSS